MLQDEAATSAGILKLNSKALQQAELRKLEKSEKLLLAELLKAGKGERGCWLMILKVGKWIDLSLANI